MIGKRYTWIVCFCSLCCFLGFNTWSFADTQHISFAYLEAGLKDLNDADRHVAVQLLAKELIRDSGNEIKVFPLNSMAEMLDMIEVGKVNYVIINSYLYLTGRQKLQPFLTDEIWGIQRAQEAKENYVLVVAQDFNYQNLQSLLGKSISIHKDYLLVNFYLNYLVKKEAKLPINKFFKRIKDTRTDSQAVLDVFFKTSDSCLVPQYIVDLVAELNPSVLKGIRIVHYSGAKFIPALVLRLKNNSVDTSNMIRNNLLTLSDNARGQEIMNLFSIKSIKPINANALQDMIKLYDEYQSMAVEK
ncbi:phosphate/phosphite/phosphonate ABC transporter substrate-binding protein [Methylomonas lenta]|uniref:phosphate/phosphite/phosphonate ABC transporter substrate-binding protein n=1 Tax=Methylomonas lenta TaxID=980561 RepID=UPI0009FD022E|nr:PhnD/SsuA/transferrin family substrate-binding protein [Methylomonas lenta]